MQKTKFCALLMVLAVLGGSLCLSPAISFLMDSVKIRSSGRISTSAITAASGYWRDIQNAINEVASRGGGSVYIPEGTFNFVNVGENWNGARVTIPAGVNLLGAPTERTSGLPVSPAGMNPNDQVVEWNTVLVMPWDAPGTWDNRKDWFRIVGNGDPNEPSRFSDIKLVGYRSIDSTSTTAIGAIKIEDVVDFRVDHCYFENMVHGIYVSYINHGSRGVIDHSYLVNTYGYVEPWIGNCTVYYGVGVYRMRGDVWEEDISQVLGKYTNYTTVIEDCYFEKWRHVVSAMLGAHYVFRHNTVQDDYGPSIDAHGWFWTECSNTTAHAVTTDPPVTYDEELGVWRCDLDGCGEILGGKLFVITLVGTRAIEVYNNKFIDSVQYDHPIQFRGGAGVVFNNEVSGENYDYFIYLGNDEREKDEAEKVWCNDIWIWGNTLLGDINIIFKYDPYGQIIEGENYYFYAPHTFDYVPYPYPHPLTLEPTP